MKPPNADPKMCHIFITRFDGAYHTKTMFINYNFYQDIFNSCKIPNNQTKLVFLVCQTISIATHFTYLHITRKTYCKLSITTQRSMTSMPSLHLCMTSFVWNNGSKILSSSAIKHNRLPLANNVGFSYFMYSSENGVLYILTHLLNWMDA